MLEKLLKPFTTSTAGGTAFRELYQLVTALITILGILGWLSQDQVTALLAQLKTLASPEMVAAVGAILFALMSIYRIFFKSSSDKAAEVAKKVDAEIPAAASVVIQTPVGQPDIVVKPE